MMLTKKLVLTALTCGLMTTALQATVFNISGETNDTFIGVNGTNGTPSVNASGRSATGLNVGGNSYSYSKGDTVAIIVFRLPTLTAEIITNANLTITWSCGYPGGDSLYPKYGQLHGTRYSASSVVTTNDYAWNGIPADNVKTLIQSNLFVMTNSAAGMGGAASTDSSGSTSLATWLNAQYTAGAVGGDYVFLRVSLSGRCNNPVYVTSADSTSNQPFLTFSTLDVSAGPCDLSFTNTFPEQQIQKPATTTNFSLVIKNSGYLASNVTVALSVNAAYTNWLTVNSGTVTNTTLSGSRPNSTPAGLVTNLFNVAIASNAPAGVYSDAFTLQMQGRGTDGAVSNFPSQIGLQILETVFTSMDKNAFSSDVGGSDAATLTISNTANWALSYSLSSTYGWLVYPTGTLSLVAGGTTNVTVTASAASLGQGQYTDTLNVNCINNHSTVPNPKTFSVVFDVGPKIEPVVTNRTVTWVSGGYLSTNEPGATVNIVIPSVNNGAITVTNIAHTLSADSHFAITPIRNVANYGTMLVGATTSTTYQVVIVADTPEGNYTFYATNAIPGVSWNNSFSIFVKNSANPTVSPASITMNLISGATVTNQQVVVTNLGNADVTFNITDNGIWDNVYTAVLGSNGISGFVAGGNKIALVLTNAGLYQVVADGVSSTKKIGFSFPFYGVNYSNFYVTADGYIGLVNATSAPSLSTNWMGKLPAAGGVPLIAPLWGVLSSPTGSIRYVNNADNLVVSYVGVSQGSLGGTNLEFQVALYTNGNVEFRYKNVNGLATNFIAIGFQGGATSYTNLAVIPVNGTSVLLTPGKNRWVTYSPSSATVGPLSSQIITFIADATGTTNTSSASFTTQFNWNTTNAPGTVAVTAAASPGAPIYSAESTLSFTGAVGQVTSVPFVISNTGNATLTFSISNSSAETAGYINTNAVYDWIDISTNGTDVLLEYPMPGNSYVTAADEGFGAIPIGFTFPFDGSSYTQLCVSVNGALRFDAVGRVFAVRDLATTNYYMPASIRMVAACWTDLILDENATIKYRSTADNVVITWENVRQQGQLGGSNLTFQAILQPDGDIILQYKHLEGARWQEAVAGRRGATTYSTVSIAQTGDWSAITNAASGTVYTQYVNSVSNRAVQFRPAQVRAINYSPSRGSIPSGTSAVITFTGDAANQSVGTNSATTNVTLIVNHNAAGITNALAVTFTATNSLQTGFIRAALIDDSDGDGMTDDQEKTAGTDSQDSSSVFTPRISRDPVSGTVLSWDSPIDGVPRTYKVYFTTDLMGSWTELATVTDGTGYVDTDEAHLSVPVVYYKVSVVVE